MSLRRNSIRRFVCCRLLAALLLAVHGVSLANIADAEEPAASGPIVASKEDFHLYLLLGQSNMAGRGKMTPADRKPVANVYMLDAQNHWQPAAHPLHFDKPSMAGVGLGIDFAIAMRDGDQPSAIGLIPCAFGGTRLDQWQKGTMLYREAIDRATIGAKSGVLRGILWHQGESDSTEELAPTYAARLTQLFSDLRNDLHVPELPIVVGELGPFRQPKNPFNDVINGQLHVVAAEVPGVAAVSADRLHDVGDQTHFDADSLREFGRRYAAAMQASAAKE